MKKVFKCGKRLDPKNHKEKKPVKAKEADNGSNK